jgi:hypothetical protein
MTSQKEVLQRWLIWNARGKGKEMSPLNSGGRYHYHGQVLYSHEWPVARLIRGVGKDYVCLTRSGVKPENLGGDSKLPRLAMTITVPCIGAFSKFYADVLPEYEQHERIKWLSHLEAQEIIELAQATAPGQLVTREAHNSSRAKRMANRLATVEQVYLTYRKAFGLKWPDWPGSYTDQLDDIVKAKRKEWNDPKNVEKRQRAAARREGKKAFDDITDN